MVVYAFIITILLSFIIGSIAGFIVGVILTGKYEESNKKKGDYNSYNYIRFHEETSTNINELNRRLNETRDDMGGHSIRIKVLEEELHKTIDSLTGSMNRMHVDIMNLKDSYYELCEKLEDDNK